MRPMLQVTHFVRSHSVPKGMQKSQESRREAGNKPRMMAALSWIFEKSWEGHGQVEE